MSQPISHYLLPLDGKSWAADLWAWFLGATVPLPALVGVPAVLLALARRQAIFHVVVQGAEGAAQFMTQLGLFLAYLPATTVAVATELFFTVNVLDAPLSLWLSDFARGFARGLGRSLLVFSHDLEAWSEARRDGAHTPDGTPPSSPGSVGQPDETESSEDTDTSSSDGSSSDGSSSDGDDGDGFLRYEDPDHDRTGTTSTELFDELGSWAPFTRHALGLIWISGFVLLVVFVVCNLADSDGACGTSEVCGGPNGEGEFACLWYNAGAIRGAATAGVKPLKYRFFWDGTRMQFPDR